MKIVFQIASACLLVQLAFAAKGPVAEPVCDAVCPDTFPIEDNWHIPYTNDCTKFCHCANDGNWMKLCPGGLHFNPELQVCDWPDRAGCVEGGNVTDAPVTPKPAPDGCENVLCDADDCFDFANTNDCQAYCDCDHGKITLKECAAGLHFNPVTGDCDFPENANCEIKPPPPNGCEDVKCGDDDCFKTSNALECNAYCDCDHGNVTVGLCSPGLHWNAATGACDFPENAQCEEPNTTTPGDDGTETKPDPEGTCNNICPKVWPIVDNNHLPIPGVCTQFCHCANDGNWLKECPDNLHFNAAKQVCDWPQDAGCEKSAKSNE